MSSDPYRIMGHVYDLLSQIYSGGRIGRCKTAMIDKISPGDRVLFAGVGRGNDAVAAAEKGARVTVVDLSPTMLGKFSKKIEARKFPHQVSIVESDILKFTDDQGYDFVFANFFLNVFPRDFMDRVLGHLASLAKKGGYVVIGDFAYPSGNFFARLIQRIYWFIAVTPFYLMTSNAFHDIYNYPLYARKNGLVVEEVRTFRFLFDVRYWSLLCRRNHA